MRDGGVYSVTNSSFDVGKRTHNRNPKSTPLNRDDDDENEVEVEKGDKPVIDILPVDPFEPFVPLHILCSSLCQRYIVSLMIAKHF